MSIQKTHSPLLLSGIRKYGRYDNFNPIISSGHASIGSKSIGKIHIDCELLFQNSQRGILGDGKLPAGILYFNLNFGPPQGCRVKSATITMTLDEEANCLGKYRSGRIFHDSGCPVQITEWYGPSGLAGQNKTAIVHRTTKLTPELNVLGNGGGGVGFQSNKAFTHSARWSFHGQLLRGSGNKSWTYRSLCWNLNENELESQSFHSNKVRTAFTFEHLDSGQPFLMRVDIDGKLEKWKDRIQSKLKFGTTSAKEDKVVTLVDFEDYTRFQHGLVFVAEGLPRAMELQHLQEVPVEVPDSIPGTFFPSAPASPFAEHPQNPAPSISTPSQTLAQPGGPALPMAENPSVSQHEAVPVDNQAAYKAQEFMRALHELQRPDMYRILPEDGPSSSRPTVVGTDGNGPGVETTEATKSQGSQRTTELSIRRRGEEEAIASVLEFPRIIMVLRLLASLTETLGTSRSWEEETEGPKQQGT